jgi:uncharacterized SAM-binding protein YcdF (DUF218 family)
MTSGRSRGAVVALASAILLGGLMIAYAGWTYTRVRTWAGRDGAGPADAIIVMGAAQYNGTPSPVLKARLDHARFLFGQGLASIIVTTGGYGPDPNFSEAHAGARYLTGQGIDPSQIMTEQGSGSTHDTVLAASRLMQSHGWTRAIVVSDGFHLYRLERMFEDNGVQVRTSPASESVIEASPSTRFWFSMREVLLVSVYRLERLVGIT